MKLSQTILALYGPALAICQSSQTTGSTSITASSTIESSLATTAQTTASASNIQPSASSSKGFSGAAAAKRLIDNLNSLYIGNLTMKMLYSADSNDAQVSDTLSEDSISDLNWGDYMGLHPRKPGTKFDELVCGLRKSNTTTRCEQTIPYDSSISGRYTFGYQIQANGKPSFYDSLAFDGGNLTVSDASIEERWFKMRKDASTNPPSYSWKYSGYNWNVTFWADFVNATGNSTVYAKLTKTTITNSSQVTTVIGSRLSADYDQRAYGPRLRIAVGLSGTMSHAIQAYQAKNQNDTVFASLLKGAQAASLNDYDLTRELAKRYIIDAYKKWPITDREFEDAYQAVSEGTINKTLPAQLANFQLTNKTFFAFNFSKVYGIADTAKANADSFKKLTPVAQKAWSLFKAADKKIQIHDMAGIYQGKYFADKETDAALKSGAAFTGTPGDASYLAAHANYDDCFNCRAIAQAYKGVLLATIAQKRNDAQYQKDLKTYQDLKKKVNSLPKGSKERSSAAAQLMKANEARLEGLKNMPLLKQSLADAQSRRDEKVEQVSEKGSEVSEEPTFVELEDQK